MTNNVKGPAEAATSPSHVQKQSPTKDIDMNSSEHTTPETSMPAILSIDAFLAKAPPSERVAYHANALQEALAELRPDHAGGWQVLSDLEQPFVLVTAKVVRRAGL